MTFHIQFRKYVQTNYFFKLLYNQVLTGMFTEISKD